MREVGSPEIGKSQATKPLLGSYVNYYYYMYVHIYIHCIYVRIYYNYIHTYYIHAYINMYVYNCIYIYTYTCMCDSVRITHVYVRIDVEIPDSVFMRSQGLCRLRVFPGDCASSVQAVLL